MDIEPTEQMARGDQFNVYGVKVSTKKLREVEVALQYFVAG